MKGRIFYTTLFTFFLVSSLFTSTNSFAQSETHDFVTYDTLINAPSGFGGITWRLRISRPKGMFGNGPDAADRPLIMFSPGQGEMGTDYSKLQYAGPHYWLNNGWDGGITLPNGKHYPILITAISSNKYFSGKEYAEMMNIILSIYHIKRNSVHVGGLSQGGFASSGSIYYERTPGDEFGMKQITSLVALQGVDEWPTGYPNTANKYNGPAWGQWAKKYGGKFFGLEGTADLRYVYVVSNQMNATTPGSAYFGYETIGGGGHCCWNDMMNPSRTNWRSVAPYGTNMTGGQQPTAMGTYQSGDYIMKWMLLQGDISLVGGAAPAPNVAPVVNAGYAQTITLPATTASLSGSATDSDGSISSASWSKVSGPAAVISNPSGYTTAVTGLVAGTYVFRLSATDNSGSTSSADVTITVNAAAAPAPPPPGGGLAIPGKIESENYSAMNNIRTDGSMDIGGTSLVGWINAGSWMDYNVNVASAGAYTVNLRIAAPAAGSQLQIRNASGAVLSTVNIPVTYSYLTWQTISTTIILPAGSQTIKIYAVTAGWNINWMEFISNGGGAPAPGYKPIPGKIESESYDASNSIQTDVCADVNGGRYVGWINAGSWMDYNVNVAGAGGVFSINLRIAAPAAGSQLQLRNTAGTVLATVTIPNTSSYLTWQTISSSVRLPAGNQTIRIYAVNAGWNINWMEFIAQASSPGATGPSAGYVALPATIESEDYTSMNNVKTDASMDVSGGNLVGWIYPGSWMDYNVYSPDAGDYTVNLRIASPNWGSQLQIQNSAGEVLSTINIPNTNSYLTWQTISSTISLPAGDQTLRVFAVTAGWNINWLEFTNGSALITQSARVLTTTASPSVTTAEKAMVTGTAALNIYPNPVNDNFTLELNNAHLGTLNIQVVDLSGAVKKVYTYKKEQLLMRANLSAAGLAPGSYFIRVSIGNWKEVKKMIKL